MRRVGIQKMVRNLDIALVTSGRFSRDSPCPASKPFSMKIAVDPVFRETNDILRSDPDFPFTTPVGSQA